LRETVVGDYLNSFAAASQRAPGLRGFQVLGYNDLARLEAFLLAFDFDQRRAYFGGGVSDASIRDYCKAIRWADTTIVARSGPYCLEAMVVMTALTTSPQIAELSMACPLSCDRRPIVADLFELALMTASLSYRQLVVAHELAMPDLLSLLRGSALATFDGDVVRIAVPFGHARVVAC
jgi:hypothetical protein